MRLFLVLKKKKKHKPLCVSFLRNPEDVSDKEKLVTKERMLPQRSQNWERLGDGNLTLSCS